MDLDSEKRIIEDKLEESLAPLFDLYRIKDDVTKNFIKRGWLQGYQQGFVDGAEVTEQLMQRLEEGLANIGKEVGQDEQRRSEGDTLENNEVD